MTNKKCPICKKQGTTSYKIEFHTCDDHNQQDVLRTMLEDSEDENA